MKVSVVICTLSERESLIDCVQSLLGQTVKPYKIIVIAVSNSQDAASRLVSRFPGVEVVNFKRRNLAEARNLGVDLSKEAEIVAFIDDDTVAQPSWLHQLVASFEDDELGVVGGSVVNQWDNSVEIQVEENDAIGRARVHKGQVIKSSGYRYWIPVPKGSNFSVRKVCWSQIGGFDNFFSAWKEETDFTHRAVAAGWSVTINREAMVTRPYNANKNRRKNLHPHTLAQRFASLAYLRFRNAVREGISLRHILTDLNQLISSEIGNLSHMLKNEELSHVDFAGSCREIFLGIRLGIREATSLSVKDFGEGVMSRKEVLASNTPKLLARTHLRPSKKHLVLVTFDSPWNSNAGGIARWYLNLARSLSSKAEVTLVTWNAQAKSERTQMPEGYYLQQLSYDSPDGSNQYLSPNYAGGGTFFGELQAFIPRLLECIDDLERAHKISVIFCPVWQGVSSSFPRRWTTIVTAHTLFSQIFDREKFSKFDQKAIYDPQVRNETVAYKTASRILANSNESINQIKEIVTGKDIHLVPHSVSPPEIESRPLNLNQVARKKLVLSIGRHESRKGTDLVFKAWEEFSRECPEYRLCLIGTGEQGIYSEVLRGLSKDVRHKMTFVESCSEEKKWEYLAKASLVLYPSRYESFGLVAVESMAAGTPVLAAPVGGLADVLEGYPVTLGGLEVDEIKRGMLAILSSEITWLACSRFGAEKYETSYRPEIELGKIWKVLEQY